MAHYCRACRHQFPFTALTRDGYCAACDPGEQAQPEPQPRASRRQLAQQAFVLTTETAVDFKIDRLGIVSAEAIVGINALKDLTFELRDIFGGPARAQQDAMARLKAELFAEIERQARQRGADMVIGMDLRFADFGQRGSAILATAIGTAARRVSPDNNPEG